MEDRVTIRTDMFGHGGEITLTGESARKYRLNFEDEEGTPRAGIALSPGQSLLIEWNDGVGTVTVSDFP